MTESRLPNLIIAGAVKAGTTSVFRYLLEHPDVCGSAIKETCYFLPLRYGQPLPELAEYRRHFRHCGAQNIIVESTPGYLDGGSTVAAAIARELRDVRVLVVLRNPVDRLRSFLAYQQAQVNLPADLTLDAYVDACLAIPEDERAEQRNDAYWGVDGGRYVHHLSPWFEIFGQSALRVMFFDDVVANPHACLLQLGDWLNINTAAFNHMKFRHENRTVPYRFAALQKVAIATNRLFEPVMRKTPGLKRMLRGAYYAVNADSRRSQRTALSDRVASLYEDDNQALATLLRKAGYRELPDWLQSEQSP